MDAAATLQWLDWTLLAVLAASVVIGCVRGLTFEVMSLLGWVVAWFAAQWGAPLLSPYLPVGTTGSALNLTVSMVLCFVLALLLWSLLAKLVRLLVRATPLSLVDRFLGALFGLLRGGVILLVLASVVAMTPMAQSAPWQASRGVAILDAALQTLKPLLPAKMGDMLPAPRAAASQQLLSTRFH